MDSPVLSTAFPARNLCGFMRQISRAGVAGGSAGAKITVKGLRVQPGFLTQYLVQKMPRRLPLGLTWSDPAWTVAETLEITHFRPESSSHRPRTFAKLL